MTDSAGRYPGNRKCKFENSEPHYDTVEEALLHLDENPKADKVAFAEASSQINSESEDSAPRTREVTVKIGRLHAIFWSLIVVSGIVSGFLFAASLFGAFGSPTITLFGVLATLALAATVFSLSRHNVVLVKVDENSETKTS